MHLELDEAILVSCVTHRSEPNIFVPYSSTHYYEPIPANTCQYRIRSHSRSQLQNSHPPFLKMTTQRPGQIIRLPIEPPAATSKKPQPVETIDLSLLTEQDLTSLKHSDPFLYHSIPFVQKATLALKEVDHAKLLLDSPSSSSSSSIVTRKTQLATECHESAPIEDLLSMDNEKFMAHGRELRNPNPN